MSSRDIYRAAVVRPRFDFTVFGEYDEIDVSAQGDLPFVAAAVAGWFRDPAVLAKLLEVVEGFDEVWIKMERLEASR